MERPDFYKFHQGEKCLPFENGEYENRLSKLRAEMAAHDIEACVFTSMQGVAYYSGFLYCAFGRPYALLVTAESSVSLSAGIDAAQPWRRSYGDNITYTDWRRDNFWRAALSVIGTGKRIGFEADHMTLTQKTALDAYLRPASTQDVAGISMRQRMYKSAAEIALIKAGAAVADVGGYAIRDVIRPGTREIDVAMAGRDAMEVEIARQFPEAEYRDTWVWFQSGINTDGAHNPLTSRALQPGDILSLNTFPMISGYYTALERTLFVEHVDPASLRIWEHNIAAHEYGMSLLKPGVSCAEVTEKINTFFAERDLLRYRSFGYGHSFGVLSHYYGREAGLELREDIDTVLEPGMVISMEPMLTIPEGQAGAGGYREHDILVISNEGHENITAYPYGPDFNVV